MQNKVMRSWIGIAVILLSTGLLFSPSHTEAALKHTRPAKSDAPQEKHSEVKETKQSWSREDWSDSQVRYPYPVTPEIKQAFKDANADYQRQDWTMAEQRFAAFIGRFPHTELKDAALYRLAEIVSVRGKEQEARNYLQQLIQQSPDPEWRERARLLMGRSFFQNAQYQNAYLTLMQVQPNFLEAWQKVHYYSLLIRLEEKRRTPEPIYPYYFLRLYDTYETIRDPVPGATASWIVSADTSKAFLDRWVTAESSLAQVPSEIIQYVGGRATAYSLFHVGYLYFQSNDKSAAKNYLRDYVERFSNHDYSARAKELLSKIGYSGNEEKYGREGFQIGVLLPLSGPYRKFGHELLRGIRCGNGDEVRCGQKRDVKLVVRDTEGDPEIGRRLFLDLAKTGSIQAIIGPMSNRGTAVVIDEAKRFDELPVIPILQHTPISRESNIFYAGVPLGLQIKRLANHSKDLDLKRVGVLYPNTSYGKEVAGAFERELSLRGGKVIASRSYNADGTDIGEAVRQLKLTVSSFSMDAPKIFDAIFIPDSGGRVRKLADVLISQNITDIPLIGNNAWNGEPFPLVFESLFPGSFFTDIFFPQQSESAVKTFVDRFRRAYSHDPSTLEALGYDLVQFIDDALYRGGAESRETLKKELHSMDSYRGITGFSGFDDAGVIHGKIYILTQQNGTWVQVK